MKLTSLTVPVLIVSFTVVAVWALGMLAVRSSALSTQTSLDLLRLNLRVGRLHEALVQHSRDALASQVKALLPTGSVPAAVAGPEAAKETVSRPFEMSPVRPWPETAAEPGEVRP